MNQAVFNEALKTVANHYANKAKENGLNLTEQELQESLQANWDKVSGEIFELYTKSMEIMSK